VGEGGLQQRPVVEPDAEGQFQRSVRARSPVRLLDLEHFSAGVVAAVPAHAVRELRLAALRALGVGGRL